MAGKNKRCGIHKYYRARTSIGPLWACAKSDCTHHMPRHLELLMNGKKSICWQCEEPFILTPIELELEQPTCPDCRLNEVTNSPIMELLK
jgi:hypothetical protein